MSKYKEFLNICEDLRDIEKELDTYDPLDPTPSEKAVEWIKRIYSWTKKNHPDSSLFNRIQWFWGYPSQENMKKLMQELLMVYYETKIKNLQKEEFFNIIDSELKE